MSRRRYCFEVSRVSVEISLFVRVRWGWGPAGSRLWLLVERQEPGKLGVYLQLQVSHLILMIKVVMQGATEELEAQEGAPLRERVSIMQGRS